MSTASSLLHRSGFVAILLTVTAGVPAQQTLKGRVLTDEAAGYRLSLPPGWDQMPVNVDERRVLGWFRSQAQQRGERRKGDTGRSRHALLKVIRLDPPSEPAKGKPPSYDFQVRLAKRQKAGTFKATREVDEQDAVKMTRWDVRVAGEGIDRLRIVAWEFRAGERDYLVEFEVLEEAFAELEPAMLRTLRSFRFLEAVAAPGRALSSAEPFALRQWSELPLLERHRQRRLIGEAFEQKVEARVPPGWTVQRSEHYLVISHADAKTTKHVVALLEAFHAWLDERFGGLSKDLPIRTAVWLCANAAEYKTYRSGGWRAEHNFANREVVMCDDRGNLNLKDVLWSVFHHYMLDVAPEVYFNLPAWLNQGLRGVIARARLKGRKLEFPPHLDELSVFDRARRKDDPVPTVVEMMGDPILGAGPDKAERRVRRLQAQTLLRFLDGPGARTKPVGKDFLARYAAAIQTLVRELDTADPQVMVWDTEEAIRARLEAARGSVGDAKPVKIPKLNGRWERYAKLRRERAPAFLVALHQRICPWTEKQAALVERAFDRYCKSSRH